MVSVMTDKDIDRKELFRKILRVAVANSYGKYDPSQHMVHQKFLGNRELSLNEYLWLSMDKIIFSHEFIEAYFDDDFPHIHIAELALSDDRIAYLALFLEH